MADTERQASARGRRRRWGDRFAALRAGLARPAPEFAAEPEPRSIGSVGRGRQILAGTLMFAGHLIEAPGAMLWDIPAPNAAWSDAVQDFAWLDDLAAVPDPRARALAQAWVRGWIDRYGRGRGPGWTARLAARRLVRMIHHAEMLLTGADSRSAVAFRRSLGRQALFLSRRWPAEPPGLGRFEALAGMILAGTLLTGFADRVEPAAAALARECARHIDAQGGLPTRNPEELLEVLVLLTSAVAALTEAGRPVPREILAAIERIAPTLRALRHADGGLARFHGGGRGAEGRLDAALAASGVRTPPGHGLAMGYARMAAGRTTVIIDAAAPPAPAFSAEAHASTLAFELTSGRRPLVVSCGAGGSFGAEWRRAGRATPSHSALCIEGYSSSRLAPRGRLGGPEAELLIDGPRDVRCERAEGEGEHRLVLSHDGWVATHGLTCFRELVLTTDGRALSGEETLAALTADDRRSFERARAALQGGDVPFTVRFHLHPDVDARLDLGGTAVSLALRSGEVWVFRHDGIAELSLEPSVYLERGRLAPRATRQIVLSASVSDQGARVGWTLAKALDTPSHVRDVEMPDLAPVLDGPEETPR
jgi:uncharacterized heparinase superfamily protein